MIFARLVVLVELVQGIEAAQAGPCVHPSRIHLTLFVIALDCQGLVLDVDKGDPIHVVLAVGDLQTACVGGQSFNRHIDASVLVPNPGFGRVPVEKPQKVHRSARAAPGLPNGAGRGFGLARVEEPVHILLVLHPSLGAHHEVGVGAQIDLLGEEGLGLWGLLLTARDEPVQRREGLEHGRQLEHEDLPLEDLRDHNLELGSVLFVNSVLPPHLEEFVNPVEEEGLIHLDEAPSVNPEDVYKVLQSFSDLFVGAFHVDTHFLGAEKVVLLSPHHHETCRGQEVVRNA